jgi:hypothetical protein
LYNSASLNSPFNASANAFLKMPSLNCCMRSMSKEAFLNWSMALPHETVMLPVVCV